MTTTITATITRVCEGYDWIGNNHISDKRECWAYVKLNENRYYKESADTYEELAEKLNAKYGFTLPANKRDLRWFNYGEPYNRAEV